jgi:acetyl-CoA carboxylase biotin carboxyl carrier protein
MAEGKGASGKADSSQAATPDVFDVERLRELVELMKCHELSEVDLQNEQHRIRLRRGRTGGRYVEAPDVHVAPAPAPAPLPGPVAAPAPAAHNPNLVTINSPMVGTFYGRPNPESEPFVKVGDHVGPETVVCIIEAMKVFNEIQAEVSGQIVAVLVDTEESVDFGKPLFRVDTTK